MELFNEHLSYVTEWWHDKEQLDSLVLLNALTEQNIEYIHNVVKILDEVYPNHWDLQIEAKVESLSRKRISYRIYMVIYFPKVTVNNSRGQKHDIYDVYTRNIIVINHMNTLMDFSGTKLTYSYAEYQRRYAHSHLTSVSFKTAPHFSGFCTGSGVINQVRMMHESEIDAGRFDANLFKMYLFEVKQFLSWESIEGGPYQYLSNVRELSDNNNIERPDDSELREYRDIIEKQIKRNVLDLSSIDIDLDKDNRIYIIDNEEFEDYAMQFISYLPSLICSKDADGNYVTASVDRSDAKVSKRPIAFKGNGFTYKVDLDIPSGTSKHYVKPIVKSICKLLIENELNKEQFKIAAFG